MDIEHPLDTYAWLDDNSHVGNGRTYYIKIRSAVQPNLIKPKKDRRKYKKNEPKKVIPIKKKKVHLTYSDYLNQCIQSEKRNLTWLYYVYILCIVYLVSLIRLELETHDKGSTPRLWQKTSRGLCLFTYEKTQ